MRALSMEPEMPRPVAVETMQSAGIEPVPGAPGRPNSSRWIVSRVDCAVSLAAQAVIGPQRNPSGGQDRAQAGP